MSTKKDNQEKSETENPEIASDAENQEAGTEASEGEPLNVMHDPEAEAAELKDKLLRAIAEGENIRRRAERQVSDAAAYAVTSFARELLSVSDNLRRALEAMPAELQGDERLKSFVEGIEMTERELLNAFEKSGIKKIFPEGEEFSHDFHQAMFEVETNDVKPGTIIQVVQPGYVIKDRLLRPAMVGVAKPPKETGEKPDGIDETV